MFSLDRSYWKNLLIVAVVNLHMAILMDFMITNFGSFVLEV